MVIGSFTEFLQSSGLCRCVSLIFCRWSLWLC